MSVIPFRFRHVAAFVPKVETAGDLRQVTPAPFNHRCSRTVASWSGLHPSTETLAPILVHPRHIPAGSLPSLGSGWPGVCTITDPESPGTPYGSVFRDTEFSPRVSPAINITNYGSFIRLHKIPVGTFSALLPHMSPYFSPHSAARVPCTFQAGVHVLIRQVGGRSRITLAYIRNPQARTLPPKFTHDMAGKKADLEGRGLRRSAMPTPCVVSRQFIGMYLDVRVPIVVSLSCPTLHLKQDRYVKGIAGWSGYLPICERVRQGSVGFPLKKPRRSFEQCILPTCGFSPRNV